MNPEKPEADAVEQEREAGVFPETPEAPRDVPADVDAADLAEQEHVVLDDEDGYDY